MLYHRESNIECVNGNDIFHYVYNIWFDPMLPSTIYTQLTHIRTLYSNVLKCCCRKLLDIKNDFYLFFRLLLFLVRFAQPKSQTSTNANRKRPIVVPIRYAVINQAAIRAPVRLGTH